MAEKIGSSELYKYKNTWGVMAGCLFHSLLEAFFSMDNKYNLYFTYAPKDNKYILYMDLLSIEKNASNREWPTPPANTP